MKKSGQSSLASPEDQSATFIELFFDLVFVFSVTQVVGLLHHGFDAATIGQGILVFWLVWWAWTQFTWTLNTADTTNTIVELLTLVATALVFFMAIALPNAFHGAELWFAIAYVAVRLIGLGLQGWITRRHEAQKAASRRFFWISILGLSAVLAGGYLGGQAQIALWAIAIVLDVAAALNAGNLDGWHLHPEHFAERHGLFVIIALGETLIVAATGASKGSYTPERLVVAGLAVATTCSLWWTYFPRAKPCLEHQLNQKQGIARARLARDAYSLAHFVMVCGVIALALALESALAQEVFSQAANYALAAGVLLFVGGMGMALWRANHKFPALRMVLTVLTVTAIIFVTPGRADFALAVALLGTIVIAIFEQRSSKKDKALLLEGQKL